MNETDWKKRYDDLLRQSESEDEANKALEELLTRTVIRLTIAASGLDNRLEPHLKSVRNAVRGGGGSISQDKLNEITDGLLHFAEQQDSAAADEGEVYQKLLSPFKLSKKALAETTDLLEQLVSDPSEMQEKSFARLVRLLGQGNEAAGEKKSAGLFGRLLGHAEESGPKPNQILLNLLEQASWPGHWGEPISSFKHRLLKDAAADAWVGVLDDLLALSAKSFGEIQSEIQEAEDFLEELTQRLQDLGLHLQTAHEGRDKIAQHGRTLSEQVHGQVGDIGTHVAQATDLQQLKDAVSERITLIQQSIDSYLEEEQNFHQQAEEGEQALRERLTQLEKESTELRSRMVEAHHMALLDAVTGLPNRLAYEERIEQEVARWKRFDSPLTMLVWDVDDFKKINDRYGHQAGDKALRVIAQSLKARLRETDFIARFGGEEFVCLLCGAEGEEALSVAEEMRHSVESNGFHSHGKPVVVTISCGLTSFAKGDGVDQVFSRADKALYQAKRKGKNRCELV
ncbi:MAG: diguanylate cyclase [Candidatus Thiodiazotropha endolucinida]|nr:diguanylate cyclase [Candidatus Thiodiazotropha taylori]MCW4239663.1 diguanylate cyclase [Candidatus Thiodiazotropha taylori]